MKSEEHSGEESLAALIEAYSIGKEALRFLGNRDMNNDAVGGHRSDWSHFEVYISS